jgi:DNA-binding LacI/PurR family transcriptional regulator
VYSNNVTGGRLATQHLLDLGHRDIAFLANPQTDGYHGRRIGYEEAMADAGLAPRVVVTTYARAEAAEAAAALLDGESVPTAIFAHNDQAALGVLDALAARGLEPGRDVSVIGYDNSSVSSAPGTSLTSVDLGARELGRECMRLALRRLQHPELEPQSIAFEPTLVVRGTTGPARA